MAWAEESGAVIAAQRMSPQGVVMHEAQAQMPYCDVDAASWRRGECVSMMRKEEREKRGQRGVILVSAASF